MRISIKHLPRHEVFTVLYNHAATYHQQPTIGYADAQVIINLYQYPNQTKDKGKNYFGLFDAAQFLERRQYIGPKAVPMKIDLSFKLAIIDDSFNAMYSEGMCERLIQGLRLEKIEALQLALAGIKRSSAGQLLREEDRQNKVLQSQAIMLAELEIESESYAQRMSLTYELETLIARLDRLESSGQKQRVGRIEEHDISSMLIERKQQVSRVPTSPPRPLADRRAATSPWLVSDLCMLSASATPSQSSKRSSSANHATTSDDNETEFDANQLDADIDAALEGEKLPQKRW